MGFKTIGFANKNNPKRSLINNFTVNSDYKIVFIPRDDGKFTTEIIMLNIDTFKSLFMIAKTENSKEMSQYYIKLEKIFNN